LLDSLLQEKKTNSSIVNFGQEVFQNNARKQKFLVDRM